MRALLCVSLLAANGRTISEEPCSAVEGKLQTRQPELWCSVGLFGVHNLHPDSSGINLTCTRHCSGRRGVTHAPARAGAGKSAIHGWGAFAKVAHAPGDLLIEYMGELVRRSVADTRERRAYDTMVGAGTYVFGLSADACVDATRAGALACIGCMPPVSSHACLRLLVLLIRPA